MSNKKDNYEYHGMMATCETVENIVDHIYESNLKVIENKTGSKSPVCIWGKHGIGKTSLVKQIAKAKGIGFEPISPAQFEEMGDLTGMPCTGTWVKNKTESKLIDLDLLSEYLNRGWEKDISKPNQMMVSPPEWVPNVDLGDPDKGLFLIDDFNRCGVRILNGIMQLLQDGGLASWKLPEGWTIVLTANPGGGDYAITESDSAHLTRMMHISMEFEPKLWAKWASKAGIDERVINFVLTHPEVIENGEMTTPRSIQYFANSIANITDLKKDLGLVTILGQGSLDKETSIAFTSFINNNFINLVSPEEILSTKDFDKMIMNKVVNPFCKGSSYRIDIVNTIATRLEHYCLNKTKLTDSQIENLAKFVGEEGIPGEIRMNLVKTFVKNNTGNVRKDFTKVINYKNNSKLILGTM